MNFRTQKTVAKWISGITAASAITYFGIVPAFNAVSDAMERAAIAEKAAPKKIPAPVIVRDVPNPVVAQPKGDDEAVKKEKLGKLQLADYKMLGAKGMELKERLFPFGRNCENDGTTDGTGYHGTSTSISYRAVYEGQEGLICVAHSGKGGVKASVSRFNPVASNQPPVTKPVPGKGGDDAGEKERKLTMLWKADSAILQDRGYRITGISKTFGRNCNADATTDGTGYHGTSTSFSYTVTGKGNGTICIAHSGKNGSKVLVSPFVPQ